jgi:hypothetical protein
MTPRRLFFVRLIHHDVNCGRREIRRLIHRNDRSALALIAQLSSNDQWFCRMSVG